MTESTKALNSTVSTLKKNPGRLGRLVKAAKFLIVPSHQYTSGKSKQLVDEALKKLKAKRGLNGVTGEGAGPFSDKALQKSAADKKDAGYATAVGVTGAAAGLAMGRDIQKHKNITHGYGRNIRRINKGVPLSKVYERADTFDRRAAKTVKGAGRRGALIGGIAGALTGLAARKVEKSMEKKAVDQKDKNRALAATAVGSGAALGGVLTHDAKKSRIASRSGTKGAYKHMADPSIEGAEKRLAASAKTMRRMGKPLKRAGIKGAIAGGLVGAALGAAQLKKEAKVKETLIGGSAGAAAGAVAGAAVASKISSGYKKVYENGGKTGKAFLKHQGAEAAKRFKKYSRRGGVVGAVAGLGAGYASGHKKQAGVDMNLVKEAGSILASRTVQQRAQQAFRHFEKKDLSTAARKSAAKKALAAGAIVGAGVAVTKKNEQLKKQAAELVIKDGKKHRKGTVASAASKVGTAAGAVSILRGRNLKGVAKSMLKGGLVGGAYGTVRGANRLRKGEVSLSATEMHKLKTKGLSKKAAEMIIRDGKKYRKGTVGSATTTMTGLNTGMQIAGNISSAASAKKFGIPVPRSHYLKNTGKAAIGGALMGFVYGKGREHFRKKRGEESLDAPDFKKMKAGK